MAVERAARPGLPSSVSTSTIKTVLRHPCTLLTEEEADAAAGVRFAKQFDLEATGLCEYVANPAGNSTINLYVLMGTVTANLPPVSPTPFTLSSHLAAASSGR